MSLYFEARIQIRKRMEVKGMIRIHQGDKQDKDPDPQHWLQTRRASSRTDLQLLSENVNPRWGIPVREFKETVTINKGSRKELPIP